MNSHFNVQIRKKNISIIFLFHPKYILVNLQNKLLKLTLKTRFPITSKVMSQTVYQDTIMLKSCS